MADGYTPTYEAGDVPDATIDTLVGIIVEFLPFIAIFVIIMVAAIGIYFWNRARKR